MTTFERPPFREATRSVAPEAPGTPPLLEVKNVSKRFPVRLGPMKKGYVSAVEGLSFTVKRGTTVGIVGESGCGKSTAARLILGLLPLDDGDVLFEAGTSAMPARHPRSTVTAARSGATCRWSSRIRTPP
jgi:peptide/nickel transport system ATP-binding protein